MKARVEIGIIGDFDAGIIAHQAIARALPLVAAARRLDVDAHWLPTDRIGSVEDLGRFDGLWCVPGSPYRNMEGALLAISYARREGVPFLGTCGGFQHAVLEYARNVLGWADAQHAESHPGVGRAVIAPLLCSLVETSNAIRLYPGSRIAAIYHADATIEQYHCRYGLNPEFRASLVAGPLRECAEDDSGEVRAVELDAHPFFVATLFQPERAALNGVVPPLVAAFVAAAAEN